VDSGGEALTDKDRLQVGRTVFAFFLTDDQSVSAKERLERLATEDDATGLMTEALFIKQLRREFERAKRYERRLSLLAVALEGLDFIRERHGAAARNAAMKRVGFALTQALRTHDILARSEEGDDILVLLPETNAENALLVAERLARGLAGEKIAHGDQILTVRPVIGATSMDWDLSSADELLKHARQALSQARGRGDRQILAWTENPMKP
jgi:diguanylate cyclase (GGDEF)-like protein